MKLILLLAAIAYSNAAKLDRNYLPPSHAQTSGGAGSFLETPLPSNQRINGFSRGSNYAASPAGFGQNNYYVQGRNTIALTGNNFAGSDFASNYDGNVNGNYNYETRPARPQSALEKSAAILRQDNQNDGETYSFAYETENGIYAEENGVATNGVEAQGGYTYTGDDGQIYSIRYTAGQNGFIPEGDHIPTPPPVPEEILKALEQNARDEAAGIYDDGSYAEGKYGDGGGYASNNQAVSNQYNNVNNRYLPPSNGNRYTNDEDDTVVTNSASYMPEAAQNLRRISGIDNQGSGFTGANRAYLPPTESQRGFGRNAQRNFGSTRQPSYNARTGYQY